MNKIRTIFACFLVMGMLNLITIPMIPTVSAYYSEDELNTHNMVTGLMKDIHYDNGYFPSYLDYWYGDLDNDGKKELVKFINAFYDYNLQIDIHKNNGETISASFEEFFDPARGMNGIAGFNRYAIDNHEIYLDADSFYSIPCKAFCYDDSVYNYAYYKIDADGNVTELLRQSKEVAEYASPLVTFDEQYLEDWNPYASNNPEHFKDWNGKDLSHKVLRYYNDDIEVSEQEFLKEREKYTALNWITLGENDTDSILSYLVDIASDIQQNSTGVHLDLNIKSNWDKKTLADLNEWLTAYRAVDSYHIDDEWDTERMMQVAETTFNGIKYLGLLDIDYSFNNHSSGGDFDNGMRIPVQQVNDFFNKYFGRLLPTKEFSIEEREYGYAIYANKEGYYYFSDYATGDDNPIYYINAIYEINKDQGIYYIDYSELSLHMTGIDIEKYVPDNGVYDFVLPEELPSKERLQLYIQRQDYMVAKKDAIGKKNTFTVIEKNAITEPFDINHYAEFKQTTLDNQQVSLEDDVQSYGSLDNFITEIKGKLKELRLNEKDKTKLTDHISQSVQFYNQTYVPAKDNSVTLDSEYLQTQSSRAAAYYSELNNELSLEELQLLQQLPIVNQISVFHTDPDEAVYIIIKHSDAVQQEALALHDTFIRLNEHGAGIYLTMETMTELLQEYDEVILTLQAYEDRFSFEIKDATGNEIYLDELNKLVAVVPVTDTSVEVVHDGSTIINNKLDEQDKIYFPVHLNGDYTYIPYEQRTRPEGVDEETHLILDKLNQVDVIDMDDESFDPSSAITRNHFAKAIVNLYAVLNKGDKTSFTDVTGDDPYYSYIASGEKHKLIYGYEDGTFKGDTNIELLHLISISSRMLHESKKYYYPENMDDYLKFIDISLVPEEELKEVALAVQLGLINQGGMLEPKKEVSVSEAAILLEKLYQLLYPPTTFEVPVHEEDLTQAIAEVQKQDSKTLLVYTAAGSVAVILAGVVGLMVYKRRKKNPNTGTTELS